MRQFALRPALARAALVLAPIFVGAHSAQPIHGAVPQLSANSLTPRSVIARAEIERLQAGTVLDVLTTLPGISVTTHGGRGSLSSVFARGAESDHVLVLVDGVRVGSATAGQFGFEHLPVDQVERIEFERGPRASIRGSDAIGGIIHIITRDRQARSVTASATAGSRGSHDASVTLSGGGEDAWYVASASASGEDGIDACRGTLTYGCFVESEPDLDGYRGGSLALRAGYSFGQYAEVESRVLRTRGHVEFDGGFVNESRTEQGVYSASLAVRPRDGWRTELRGSRSDDRIDSYLEGEFATQFVTKRDELNLLNRFSSGDDLDIWVGADLRRDRVESTNDYEQTSRTNVAAFANGLVQALGARLEASARIDRDDQFGTAGTVNFAARSPVVGGAWLTAIHGTGFRAPSFNELYWPGFGNPELQPERSVTTELAAEAQVRGIRLGANAFTTDIEDLVAFDAATFLPQNVERARVRGIEATVTGTLAGTGLRSSLTFLDPQRLGEDGPEGELARRPGSVFTLNADRTLGDLSLGASLRLEGARFDDHANTRDIEGFTLLSIRAEYPVRPEWSLGLRVENILDRQYETVSGFNQPGRGAFLTLRVR